MSPILSGLIWFIIAGTAVFLILDISLIALLLLHNRKIRESEERYALAAAGSNDGLWDWDIKTDTMYYSSRWKAILGYEKDSLSNRPGEWLDRIHPNDRKKVRDDLSAHLERKIEHFNNEHRILHKDGTYRNVQCRGLAVYNQSGKATRMAGSLSDITDRKELERQFLHSQKMEAIGRFASGIAHDFNNILTGITGYCNLMLSNLDKDNPMASNIMEIKNAGERAIVLVRQLLTFSRKRALQPMIIDLNSLVNELSIMLVRIIGDDIKLVIKGGNNIGFIEADPIQIEQVIMNLVANSRDAMPDGGKIVIEISSGVPENDIPVDRFESQYQPYIILSVSDTGQGMDADTLQHIYEPFFTTKETAKGTGLGLSTVYAIIEQAGGIIKAYSKPGKGTTFKIYFHKVDNKKPGQLEKRSVSLKKLLNSVTILLVEPDAMVRDAISLKLKERGYDALVAGDGMGAINIWEKHHGKIDILIVDFEVPGLSGKELAKQASTRFPNIKILYLYGGMKLDFPLSKELEKDEDYLLKPVIFDDLMEKIENKLESIGKK